MSQSYLRGLVTWVVDTVPLLVTLSLLGACATGRAHESPLDSAAYVPETYLHVENRSPSEFQIYWLQGQSRFSLGRVRGLSSVRIGVPASLLATGFARLVVEERPRTLGGYHQTREFPVSLGQRIDWSLETTLERSRLSIRPW